MACLKYSLFALMISFNIMASDEPKSERIDQKEGYELMSTKRCDLHLSFGSYGTGTPLKVKRLINEYIIGLQKEQINKLYSWSWGLEGENDYCLILNDRGQKARDKIFEELKKMIPEFSKDGYTILKSNSGREWKTTWSKKN